MGFENMASLKAKTKKLREQLPRAVMDALESGANTIRNAAIIEIQAAAHGETYTRYAPKRTGTASAPGDAPHTDTGNLVNNIQVQRETNLVKVGIMGDGAIYGKYLEYGTNRITKRPWLAPALASSLPTIKDKLKSTGAELIAEIAGS